MANRYKRHAWRLWCSESMKTPGVAPLPRPFIPAILHLNRYKRHAWRLWFGESIQKPCLGVSGMANRCRRQGWRIDTDAMHGVSGVANRYRRYAWASLAWRIDTDARGGVLIQTPCLVSLPRLFIPAILHLNRYRRHAWHLWYPN